MMPKMSGFEVLKKLKEDIDTASIPIVMLTALDNDESMIKSMSLYSQDYLIKPIEINVLLEKINSILS